MKKPGTFGVTKDPVKRSVIPTSRRFYKMWKRSALILSTIGFILTAIVGVAWHFGYLDVEIQYSVTTETVEEVQDVNCVDQRDSI